MRSCLLGSIDGQAIAISLSLGGQVKEVAGKVMLRLLFLLNILLLLGGVLFAVEVEVEFGEWLVEWFMGFLEHLGELG